MEKFGKRLRELRESSEIRLVDLAREMGWSSVYLSDIERGRRNPPTAEKIRQIAEFIRCDPSELLDTANRDRKKVIINIDTESVKHNETALMLARSWEDLTDEEIEKIKRILKGDHGNEQP